ncbi:MAG: CRISPR-associated RAMP protein [Planctomycetia bacterium]|nr:CRISPR-associated RAMP protein [Candidatus Brocadia sp.]QOJ05647.1 MAG: CRISPR-associated RAMP protein [Planctomycetia bacterium]TVL96854.1 MAG: CRISPR-associated RAMP protein [Candidatus Brocadia sp. BL1]HQU32375.1 CRISPR-associated RAMP protein Csx7 [Candidatus Brocadia sapporoensis]
MNMPFGHQQLHNRYCFEGELELVTALRISSGNASDETDAPFIRTFDKTTPYIPGSSLRGAIRSEVERILASVGATAGLKSCTLFEKDCCTEKARDFLSELDKNERNQDTREKSTKNELIAAFAKDTLCDVCKLFGSTVYASRLTIEDALPVGMEGNKIPTHIRDGVGIDRDTGAAKDGAKFDYEVIEPAKNGLAFLFKMKAENVTNNDKKLLNLILSLLKHGLHVGGKRAGGLGKIKLREVEKKFYKVTGFEDSKSLWAAITRGKEIHNSIEWKEEVLC